MRFDCGETWSEKRDRQMQWHRVFAWWPVKLSAHDCRWLETVERRYPNDYTNIWEYRA